MLDELGLELSVKPKPYEPEPLDDESRAWLDADLAAPLESYDWGVLTLKPWANMNPARVSSSKAARMADTLAPGDVALVDFPSHNPRGHEQEGLR